MKRVSVIVTNDGTQILNDRVRAALVVTDNDEGGKVMLTGNVSPVSVLAMLGAGVRDILEGIADQVEIPPDELYQLFQHALLLARIIKSQRNSFWMSAEKRPH